MSMLPGGEFKSLSLNSPDYFDIDFLRVFSPGTELYKTLTSSVFRKTLHNVHTIYCKLYRDCSDFCFCLNKRLVNISLVFKFVPW